MPTRPAPKALQKKYLRAFFGRLIKNLYPSGTKLVGLDIANQGHFAFKKAVRYTLTLATPSGRHTRIIRGNVPSAELTKSLAIGLALQKKLYQHGFAFGRYRVPLSLGFFPKLRLGLYENFPGTPLAETLKRDARASARAGEWLARFHASPITVRPHRTITNILTDDAYFIENFRNGYPTALGDARTILAALEAALTKELAHTNRRSVVHGDFHPANVIVHPHGPVGVIDFGNCSMFDPLSDVGSFLAQTDRMVWDHLLSRRQAAQAKQAFVTAYFKQSKISRRNSTTAIDLYYCWWVMQILAYSVVIRSHQARMRLVAAGFKEISKILTRHHITVATIDLYKTNSPQQLKKQLTQPGTMLDFLSRHLSVFIPDAEHIDSIEVKQPGALSLTSFLTRTNVVYRDHLGREKKVILRGNFIPHDTYRLLQNLSSHHLPMMRPLVYLPKTSYLWYVEVAGDRFRETSPRSTSYPQQLTAIATTVAQLQKAPAQGESWTLVKEKAFIKSRLAVIRAHDAAHAPAAARLAKRLITDTPKNWVRRTVTAHGDLQGSNIIIGPDHRAWLIDFTMAKKFHPAHDVATFLVHLDIMLFFAVSETRRHRLRETFLKQYYKHASVQQRTNVKKSLAHHLGRAALDVIAITVTNLGTGDPHRAEYVEYLLRQHNLPFAHHV